MSRDLISCWVAKVSGRRAYNGSFAYNSVTRADWPHEDGKGFNIKLSCLPTDGRLVVREPKADPEAGE